MFYVDAHEVTIPPSSVVLPAAPLATLADAVLNLGLH